MKGGLHFQLIQQQNFYWAIKNISKDFGYWFLAQFMHQPRGKCQRKAMLVLKAFTKSLRMTTIPRVYQQGATVSSSSIVYKSMVTSSRSWGGPGSLLACANPQFWWSWDSAGQTDFISVHFRCNHISKSTEDYRRDIGESKTAGKAQKEPGCSTCYEYRPSQ